MRAGRLSQRDRREELEGGFRAIRAELEIPGSFDTAALAEADEAARRGPVPPPGDSGARRDARDLPMSSIDPAGSRDIDQAVAARATGRGHRLWYAIADPAAFVSPGGALDAATHARGVTYYSPDARSPLHPVSLSESAASLFPGTERPAVLWTFDLDSDAEVRSAHVERATIRNRRALGYREAQNLLDAGRADETLTAVAAIGAARVASQARRGAVDLRLPDQEIRNDTGGYSLTYGRELPVEAWNAQISLLTGATAAGMMIDAGAGILRTLPDPDPETIRGLRSDAAALGVPWPPEVDYPTRVRTLDVTDPAELALMYRCARGLRGAGYAAFGGGQPPAEHRHYALAGPYAHVTAPLRRLVDRYANETLLAQIEGRPVPEWVIAEFERLPSTMNAARRRAAHLHRALVDHMEAVVLSDRVGEVFDAVVLAHRGDATTVQLHHPAVVTTVDRLDADPGTATRLRLDVSDPVDRRLRFSTP